MASSNHFLSAAFLLLVASHFLCSSYGVPQNVLSTICSQTQNQEICIEILESDPRTKSADLPLLSAISLEIAIEQANQSYNTFLELHGNSTDSGLKSSYGKCVELYKDMKDKLQADLELSRKKQFKKITDLGGMTHLAYDCENGLPRSPPGAINTNMLLTIQTATHVNIYVSQYS